MKKITYCLFLVSIYQANEKRTIIIEDVSGLIVNDVTQMIENLTFKK